MNKEPDRNQRKALGKGLSALLPSRPAPGTAPAAELEHALPSAATPPKLPEHFEEFQNISLEKIRPSEQQPRSSFDSEKLMELAQSIRTNGVIQPITVYREGDNYRLIAGERRWRAAELAGLREIPALVRSIEQHQLLEIGLIENIQREDLNAIEIATAFARLAEQHGLSHEQIAERTGKDRSTITNFLRLLRLSPFVQNALISGSISVGHARALLMIADPREQAQLCTQIVKKQLSVRETEKLVKDLINQTARAPEKTEKEEPKIDPNVRAALDEMAMALGTRVRMVPKSDKTGKLEIEYYSQDDLDRIYSVICDAATRPN